MICYSGKLLREKTFTNFKVLLVFSRKNLGRGGGGGVTLFGGTSELFVKFFPPSTSHKSFLPGKFPSTRYTVSIVGNVLQSIQQ